VRQRRRLDSVNKPEVAAHLRVELVVVAAFSTLLYPCALLVPARIHRRCTGLMGSPTLGQQDERCALHNTPSYLKATTVELVLQLDEKVKSFKALFAFFKT